MDTGFKNRLADIIKRWNELKSGDVTALYADISAAGMERALGAWNQSREYGGKKACYLSAEFLIGRLVFSNFYNLGLLDEFKQAFWDNKMDHNTFEQIEDAALGNGGLGRLAACFLDSAATQGYHLDGFGLRYKYGLFKQYFDKGFQNEIADDWLKFGDPWSVRRENEKVRVDFADTSVWAVPYDMPVIGYLKDNGKAKVNTLRLWQAEALFGFDFEKFNKGEFGEAYSSQNAAETITAVLYPNDETADGKKLRLKQQYFFSSASIQHIVREYKQKYGGDFGDFPNRYAVQLNDTHPTIALPELLRILVSEEGVSFEQAFEIARDTFAYTNHTIMAEALEKWDVSLLTSVIPDVYPYIVMLQNRLSNELAERKIDGKPLSGHAPYEIIEHAKAGKNGKRIHMARLAVYGTHSTNGVAAIHSEILKNDALKEWYAIYPERFNNKTNGITQRRWLGLCNPELSLFITERVGSGWETDLSKLKGLERFVNDNGALERLNAIKYERKLQLSYHVKMFEYGFELDLNSIFDVQVKRLHEYKRQLLNALSIMDLYFRIKDGKLPDFYPTTFIFGAKSAPGYYRAKGVIKFINEIAKLVNNDSSIGGKIKVLFVQNYNVSYAEKIIPAADVSEQISTAGTEASGTGNMKFMLNGAVTLGTYDGANVEIVEQAGEENNYIFGARVDEINSLEAGIKNKDKDAYNPHEIYQSNPRIKRVLDTLVDGTFTDESAAYGSQGMLRDLYNSILYGASWHHPDQYFLLRDFEEYVEAKERVNRDYQNCQPGSGRMGFAKKCLYNIANAGQFSSDRTIAQYASEIWKI